MHYNPLIQSEPKALKFTTEEPTAYLMIHGIGNPRNLEYSMDCSSWTNPTYQTPEDADFNYVSFIQFGKDTPIYLRGNNPNGLSEMTDENSDMVLINVVNSNDDSSLSDIQPVEYACSGNIMHLLSYTEDLMSIPCPFCFYGLFSSMLLPNLITSAPELPATTLDMMCYGGMFMNCTSLTTAPELPAVTLTEYCYAHMFNGCTSLHHIKVGDVLSWNDDCAEGWVEGVSPIGEFEIPSQEAAQHFYRSGNCVPSTWAIKWQSTDNPPEPLKISIGNKTAKLRVTAHFDNSSSFGELPNLEYRIDDEWISMDFVEDRGEYGLEDKWVSTIEFSNDIYIRGNNPSGLGMAVDDGGYIYMLRCVTIGVLDESLSEAVEYRSSGNVMGLISYTDGFYSNNIPVPYCFAYLFSNFSISTGFVIDNSSIIDASELSLPAENLQAYCYAAMFRDCTSLTTAPTLPATTLADSCYLYMFLDCTSLNYVKCLATDISASSCLSNWMSGVHSGGTFVKKAGVTYPSGVSGIPTSWTVEEV